jgi:hypothetical protein
VRLFDYAMQGIASTVKDSMTNCASVLEKIELVTCYPTDFP